MAVRTDFGVIFERGDTEHQEAWQSLIDAGHDPHAFMYMHSREHGFKWEHAFKDVDTRQYTRVLSNA